MEAWEKADGRRRYRAGPTWSKPIKYAASGRQPEGYKGSKGVKCHGCGKEGHIRPNCPDNGTRPEINAAEGDNGPAEYETMTINDQKYEVLMDTGATHNIITTALACRLNNEKRLEIMKPDRTIELKLINGSVIKVKQSVRILIIFRNRREEISFLIVKSEVEKLIIGNEKQKELKEQEIKGLPMECVINTATTRRVAPRKE